MKTIRPPHKPEDSEYDLKCKHCKAVLRAALKELCMVSDHDGNAYVLKCPHCKTETWFAFDAIEKYKV